ncbi:MAG: LysM domain-containing protein [Phycisphaerae bacterium]|nr:LysM domain-containing protein [Phycisphaerae bacterium]
MRRMLVMMTGVAAALLAGCADKNAETTTTPQSTATYDTGGAYTTTGGATTSGGYGSTGNPYGGGSTYSTGSTEPSYAPGNYATTSGGGGGYASTSSGGAGGGGQSYTVQRGDTLYKLARQFYGDQARWRDIYNANSGQIPNPNQLPAGITLMIP